uniref:KIB1-4 beta-propeller domain-containing protein n=1 Tax=Fagus sylvatica TaxID=28930 RepID=A0A2N9F2Y1_FAGSY
MVTSQWSLLPMDLLNTIEEHVELYVDKVRLRCVCSSWHSDLSKMPNHKLCQLPWLLIPYKDNVIGTSISSSCGFLDPLEKKVHKLELPEIGEKVFKGSAYGWVVVANKNDTIYLVNPLTRARVKLPPRSKFPDVRKYRADKHESEYLLWSLTALSTPGDSYLMDTTHVRNYLLTKIVLSSSPSNGSDFVAVAIYGEIGSLAYCKRGDKKWSIISDKRPPYKDVIFYEGQLYALKGSSSGLMMVQRWFESSYIYEPSKIFVHKTTTFKIFKLDISGRNWYRVKSLGDDVMFLGLNSSMAFSSRDFPVYKGNSIYFTDVNYNFDLEGTRIGFDEGIFSLDDGKIEPLPTNYGDVWPTPIWVMPNPY